MEENKNAKKDSNVMERRSFVKAITAGSVSAAVLG
nr:twin-arginine translocation signal domain-containing protein [Segetibacter sp.]